MRRKKGIGFKYALRGVIIAIRSERNMRIHCMAIAIVSFAGWLGRIETWSWVAISLCFAIVMSLEIINSAMERICYRIVGEKRENTIRDIKDMTAGAVLVASIFSTVVAIFIFCRIEIITNILKSLNINFV